MSAIIALLMQLAIAVLPALLENCTKKQLRAAAKDLPPAGTFASEGEAAAALIDRAIERLPRRQKKRREALLALKKKAVVGDKIRTKPLTAAEVAEGKRLVKGIRP